jgi:hypothetical protein
MMALRHLEYKIPVAAEEFLNQGFDVVVDYFCGDWWKNDEQSRRDMDKTRKRRDLTWFRAFSTGLLLGLLSARWKELAKVCSWVEAGLRHEYMGDDVDEPLVTVYKSVAAGLRPEPMPRLAQMEAKIKQCRTLREKLLFAAWDAARQKDQSAFDATFVKSVQHFAKNFRGGMIAIEWVAPHQSVVGLAAMRLGMKLPELPPKLDALIMTRRSLGLSD